MAAGAANTGDEQRKQKRKMNVVKTMITIVICFCICYLPYNVYDTSPLLASMSYFSPFLLV